MPTNKWFLGPTWVLNPNGISISSAIFCRAHYCDRPRDHTTRPVTIGRIYVCSMVMRPNNITIMFMVLSSLWDFNRFIWWTQTERQPQAKPTNLGCESADKWLLPSTSTITICYYHLVPKMILIYHSREGGRLNRPTHCSGVCSPWQRLHIAVAIMINTTVCSIEPGSSHTTVAHPTTTPLWPALPLFTFGVFNKQDTSQKTMSMQ